MGGDVPIHLIADRRCRTQAHSKRKAMYPSPFFPVGRYLDTTHPSHGSWQSTEKDLLGRDRQEGNNSGSNTSDKGDLPIEVSLLPF